MQALQDAFEKDKWKLGELIEKNDQEATSAARKALERYAKHTMRPFQIKNEENADKWATAESDATKRASELRLDESDPIKALNEMYLFLTTNYYRTLEQKVHDYIDSLS